MFDIRKNIFKAIIYLSFIFLATNLFYLQVIKHSFYKQRSIKNRIRIIPLPAPRGVIYDRSGNILVDNRISFDLAIIGQEVEDLDITLDKLSKLSGIPRKDLYKNYRKNYIAPFTPTIVAPDMDKHKAFFLDENIASTPGVILWSNPRRDYKLSEATSHIVGYIGKMDEAEYKTLKGYGYRMREYVGKTGIEEYYNSYLRGEDGGIQVEVNARSRQVKQLGYKPPIKGKDIFLTIDAPLQEMVHMLLKDEHGAFIVMNAKSGEILALASSPSFDPNVFVDPNKDKQRLALLKAPAYPMINRAISATYPPGSTFKVVVAASALASGKINKNTEYNCSRVYRLGNTEFKCWKKAGHGNQSVIDALTHSCNVFFYNTARAIGPDAISQYASKFGLGEPTHIDLPWEASALVPSPLWKRFNRGEPWRPGDTLNFAIGQGYLLVTPIQVLKMITLIANEGFAPRPYLVGKIEELNLQGKTHNKITIVQEKDEFNIIKKGLFNVVNASTGSGQRAKVEDLAISGKTGTAQVHGANEHAWFTGYLPFKDPQISFVIFLEHGGSGGRKPADMARVLCKYLQEKEYIE